MRISSFRISNYKSFIDSGEINLSPGFNVIIGQNNVGKTALLEALGLTFSSKPHKSLLSIPQPSSSINSTSSAEVTFTSSGEEVKEILIQYRSFYMAVPAGFNEHTERRVTRLLEDILARPNIDFKFSVDNGHAKLTRSPSHGLYKTDNQTFFRIDSIPNTDKFTYKGDSSGNETSDFGFAIAGTCIQRIYSFRAERLGTGPCPFGPNATLKSDASNLAEVLHVLQSKNPNRFRRLNSLLRKIFPSIYEISIRPKENQANFLEIVVWIQDPITERDDLAIELSESGTGVGQVLAILYVAINSIYSRVILIDEPNSFLHPGAARKLIEILASEFPQHQYIVTTHSAEIIKAANPKTLTLIRWERPKSVLENLDVSQIAEVGRCLVEVGAKLSDVFGADQIMWVEGPTEEECFPLILRNLNQPLLGISIVAVRNTGDFENKRVSATQIWEIYSNLSKGNALLPNAVGFIFDQESRTEREIDDLKKRSKGLVCFLPRRTYENYLIYPPALTAIMLTLTGFQKKEITEDKVYEWIVKNGGNRKYLPITVEKVDLNDKLWLKNVHGAKLLEDLFQELSEAKEQYRKTIHSIQITEWLIQNQPGSLTELVDFLKERLERKEGSENA